jgi:hypothetical protein
MLVWELDQVETIRVNRDFFPMHVLVRTIVQSPTGEDAVVSFQPYPFVYVIVSVDIFNLWRRNAHWQIDQNN